MGGTALSGFYAGHRKSDDLDLFTSDAMSQRAVVLAAKSLVNIGAKITDEAVSMQYYHAQCSLDHHLFTLDAVEDGNLFRVGTFHRLENGVIVCSLETLLGMKVATLVSRCSEKDLYDLSWLREKFPGADLAEWMRLGQGIDGGVSAESILAVLLSNRIRESACGFSLDPKLTAKKIARGLNTFQKRLVKELTDYLKHLAPPPLARLVKKARQVLR